MYIYYIIILLHEILTTQGRRSSFEYTPGVWGAPPLYTGNDGHLRPVCSNHQPKTRMTEPPMESGTPAPYRR